jgi:hypothetical protein
MVAITVRPAAVPGLAPYDPDQSMSLAAASRLGLVPGHDGRRATTAEVRRWAVTGFAVGPRGPSYLFPTTRVGGALRTTVPWCCAWVRFIAAVRTVDGQNRDASPRPADARKAA